MAGNITDEDVLCIHIIIDFVYVFNIFYFIPMKINYYIDVSFVSFKMIKLLRI